MTDIDDLLDDRMTGGSGDYPPWFDEEDTGQGEPPIQEEGDVLQGVITQKRDDPFYDPDEDEGDPKPILHVQDDEDNEWSTRTHSVLVQLIRDNDPDVGDYIRIQHDGSFKTKSGQVANDYQIGVVRKEELEEVDVPTSDGGTKTTSGNDDGGPSSPAEAGAEMADPSEIEEDEDTDEEDDDTSESRAFDPSEHTVADIKGLVPTIDDVSELEALMEAEKSGKDRKTTKKVMQERIDELSETEESEDSDDEETEGELPGDVLEFAHSLMKFHEELTFSELEDYLNETRDFDVSPEAVAEALDDVKIDGETAILDE